MTKKGQFLHCHNNLRNRYPEQNFDALITKKRVSRSSQTTHAGRKNLFEIRDQDFLLRASSSFTKASVISPVGFWPTDVWNDLIAATVFAPILPSGLPTL